MKESRSGFAAARDGERIGYTLYQGDDELPRLTLVHSLALDRTFWDAIVKALVDRTSVLTFDCRGHGQSSKASGPYDISLFASDLADLLDTVGWDRAVVAGASMGGSVALAFAAAYPQRVKALGLFDTTAWYGPGAPQDWAERAERARTAGMASLTAFQTSRWFSDAFREAHPDILESLIDIFKRTDIACYAETCRMLGALDLRPALPLLTMPTAVLVGEEDHATPPAMARALHEGIAGSTFAIIESGRHLTPIENPECIAPVLAQLLRN